MKKEEIQKNLENNANFQQEQIHNILFNREIGWQEIIYDLINTEQLDPWDIDISILTERYMEKIKELEEADFFISSKVLLAASLLIRIKSEILLNKYMKSIDDILFERNNSEEKISSFEKIELEENIPELIPKSPIPRYRKVTLKELMESLNKAIKTENRRIKKEVINKNALRETGISIPKKKFNIKDKIRNIHTSIIDYFKNNKDKKVSFTHIIGQKKEERIDSFFPLLQLENQKKVWLEQEAHFDEIHIWEHKTFFKHNPNYIDELINEIETEKNIEKIKYKEIKLKQLKKQAKRKSVSEFIKETEKQ